MQSDSAGPYEGNEMSKSKSWGLAVVFLAIAVFVSGSLVATVRANYAPDGQSPALLDAIHLLQKA